MAVLIEKFRVYANAFESAVQDEDTAEAYSGWADIIKQETDLLEMMLKMIKNRDNDEGRKIAVLLCKHRKESVRFVADKVMRREKFEVEDRSNITL